MRNPSLAGSKDSTYESMKRTTLSGSINSFKTVLKEIDLVSRRARFTLDHVPSQSIGASRLDPSPRARPWGSQLNDFPLSLPLTAEGAQPRQSTPDVRNHSHSLSGGGFLCAGHVHQLWGESPLANLMEVKA